MGLRVRVRPKIGCFVFDQLANPAHPTSIIPTRFAKGVTKISSDEIEKLESGAGRKNRTSATALGTVMSGCFGKAM